MFPKWSHSEVMVLLFTQVLGAGPQNTAGTKRLSLLGSWMMVSTHADKRESNHYF